MTKKFIFIVCVMIFLGGCEQDNNSKLVDNNTIDVELSSEKLDKEYYLPLAKEGDATAQNRLGLLSIRSGNYQEGKYWFFKSAKQNNTYAQRNLSLIYSYEKNYKMANILEKKSAENGNSVSQYMFGRAILYDLDNEERSAEEAEYWLKKVCEQDNVAIAMFACEDLGYIWDGFYFDEYKDKKKAKEYFKKSIELGNSELEDKLYRSEYYPL